MSISFDGPFEFKVRRAPPETATSLLRATAQTAQRKPLTGLPS
jgi:hypothetical protein